MSIKTRVLEARYRVRENKPVITLLCRCGRKRHIVRVVGFRPYLYVHADAPDIEHPAIDEVVPCEKLTIDGDRVKKIYVFVPKDVRSVRTFYDQTWEADVLFGLRLKIDKGIKEGIILPDGTSIDHEITLDEKDVIGY